MRFKTFKNIIGNSFVDNEIELRNLEKIRILFCELICILCYSRKKHAFESFTIKDSNDFNLTNLTSRLKAPDIKYVQEIYKKDDPKELFIAINEFCYHISKDSRNITSSCYWTEWILQFESLCKNKKIICECERREFPNVDNKYKKEPVWLIWECLLKHSIKKDDSCHKIIESLLNLYCIKFTSGVKKKRKYIIYSAISYLTEEVNFKMPLVDDKNIIKNITNIMYKAQKKYEVQPETNYLFTGLEKTNMEKSLEKMEILNGF